MSNNSKIFGQQKILNHPEKIANWCQGGDETIITVEIDMTNACNSNCPGCIGGRNNSEKITYVEAKNIIDQLVDIKAKALIFTGGGEPTVNPDTLRAVVYAKESGLDVGYITNGMIMTDEVAETILKNCVWIRISLDAGTPDMFKKIHGLGEEAFYSVIENIKKLVQFKKKLKSNCTIGVAYLTGRETKRGMHDFARLSSTLGVDYAQFRPFHNDFTDVGKEIGEVREKYENDMFKIVGSIQKYSKFKEENKRPYTKCYGVNFCTVICADGTVQTCCHTRGKDKYILGNIKKDSLRNIWSNREKVFSKIDFADCGPYFCRADEFNRLLFEIASKKNHVNFL